MYSNGYTWDVRREDNESVPNRYPQIERRAAVFQVPDYGATKPLLLPAIVAAKSTDPCNGAVIIIIGCPCRGRQAIARAYHAGTASIF